MHVLSSTYRSTTNIEYLHVNTVQSFFEEFLCIEPITHVFLAVREARSVSETGSYDHHMTNVVLLEALGNGGFDESLDHMTFHMQPNQGHESWRRGAVHALRGYKCQKVLFSKVKE